MSISSKPSPHFYAVINYEDAYVQPLIISAIESSFPKGTYTFLDSPSSLPTPQSPLLQIQAYEEIDFDHLMSHSSTSFANAYVIRKALIRKHYLSTTISNWIVKHPNSILAKHSRPSCHFELDYAEFLDDALVEAWELQESFQKNEDKEPADREWWILKPGMSDRGQGIRLFSTYAELESIFEEWEAERPDSDDDDENADAGDKRDDNDDYIITSDLRHFIAQPYINPPLLFPEDPRKFHIRTYVLALSSLQVYVYKPMLALFARDPYVPPSFSSSSSTSELSAHLTNTCLQTSVASSQPRDSENSVKAFWSLPSTHPSLGTAWQDRVFTQICAITGETFLAAAKDMGIHFQALPNAFEVFGLDFLVDGKGDAFLLEVNAFPDFGQTGEELRGIVSGLWKEVVGVVGAGLLGVKGGGMGEGLVKVGEVDLGRR